MQEGAKIMIELANRYKGHVKGDPAINMLIDVYNTLKSLPCGLPRGYKAQYTDKYCAEFVTAIARMCQYTDTFPNECGAMEMWQKCIQMGINVSKPEPGALIFFSYSHVGLVMEVSNNGQILTIEGNVSGGKVENKLRQIGDADIIGYALPVYGDGIQSEFPFDGTIQTAVNVRSSPANLGALNKIGLLNQGERVTVIGENGKWWKIIFKDGFAYIVKSDGRIDIVKRN